MGTFYSRLTNGRDYIYIREDKRAIKIMNRSYKQSALQFYAPLIDYIETFINTQMDNQSQISLEVIYLDSTVSIILFDIDDIIAMAKQRGLQLQMDWVDEDEDVSINSDFSYNIAKLKLKLEIKRIA